MPITTYRQISHFTEKNVKNIGPADLEIVLGEIANPETLFASFLKKEEKEDENEVENLKLKCSKDENEFTKLKLVLTVAETKSKMIDFLFNTPLEEWPSMDSANDKENFDQVKEDLRNAKEIVENLEEELTTLIESAQEKVEELEQKRKEAETKLHTVEAKKAKLESLKATHESALVGLHDVKMEGLNLPAELQKQREALRTTELALQRCDLLLTEHKRAVSRLQEKCCMAKAVQKECQHAVDKLQQRQAEHDGKTKENQEWLQNSLQVLKRITGINNMKVEGQTVTLGLSCTGSSSEVKAEVKMTFACSVGDRGESKLVAAQLGQDILDCNDVISEAIALNDPVLLIREIQRRLSNHAPVLQEVERLRHQYAIDYVHEERKLQAMLGSSGQVVCTLIIGNGYPTRGKATLTKIEGNGHHKDLSHYKPPMENPSMTDWLRYLQDQL